jgi:hypothetical protein
MKTCKSNDFLLKNVAKDSIFFEYVKKYFYLVDFQ